MKVAIYGAGAMGTALGAYITKGGKEIDLISRNRAHVQALKTGGAHVTGKADFWVKVNALTPEEMTGRYDLIFLMTKQRENAEVCTFLKDCLAEDGAVCTMQNGVPEFKIADVIGRERTYGCAVSWGAELTGDGTVCLTSDVKKKEFYYGSLTGAHGREKLIESCLSLAGRAIYSENFLGARWAKLSVNAALSSLSAVTGLTFGEVCRREPFKSLALQILNEAFAVAEECGVRIERMRGHDIVGLYGYKRPFKRALARMIMPLLAGGFRDVVSGMYRDLAAGRPCDIDHINGAISFAGRKVGVSTPVCDSVIALAHKIERGEAVISPDAVALL